MQLGFSATAAQPGQGRSKSRDAGNGADDPTVTAENPQDDMASVAEAGNEASMAQYREIAKNASEIENINADVWGALFFIVVNDFPDLLVGRIAPSAKARIVFSIIAFTINLFIQATLLFFICKLLMMPSMLDAQNLYKMFRREAFKDAVLQEDLFENLDLHYKENICGLALSQDVFVRVILFLWVTNNVQELRSNSSKMMTMLNLPLLPDGLDTRLMVRDDDRGGTVVCLSSGPRTLLLWSIFIPKFFIASFLTVTGCVWLLAAENIGDLILNSLALAFVVLVDELIAQVFFPFQFLGNLDALAMGSPKESHAPDVEEWKVMQAFIGCIVLLVSTMAIVELAIRFQPVIPDYNGAEVRHACKEFISTQLPWCSPWRTDCFPEGEGNMVWTMAHLMRDMNGTEKLFANASMPL